MEQLSPALDAPLAVLLCDDSPELLGLLRTELEDPTALQVVGEATDGAGALRLAAERRPEVIVLDLEMPGLSADELIAAIGRVAPTAAIVTFSGYEPTDVVGPRSAARVALHVPKATDLAVLGSAVREVGRRVRAG